MAYSGECNGCGACCTSVRTDPKTGKEHRFYCEHLQLVKRAIGQEGSTRCKVHSKRTVGMPVQFRTKNKKLGYLSACLPTYPRNKDAIPPECSYIWLNEEGGLPQPQWSEGYTPQITLDEVE